MAKHLRYSGEFASIGGVLWRVELLQEADEDFASVGELSFDADEPLVIEWSSGGKEEVICGSEATLRIISPDDRTYEDLYSVEVGYIRMDVYRNGELYWSGTLDPEFYEEPYERLNNYTVELTFSDFGILDRIKYSLEEMQTLQAIVEHCLSEAGINYTALDTSLISTTLDDGSTGPLGGLSVRSDNFTDEDGEQSTLEEVLEGILQPLALRIVQRAGKVYVYDLNGLYDGSAAAIEWNGDSQTMGVDKVANNVVVTFSPYSSAELISDSTLEYGGEYDVDHYNLTKEAQDAGDYGDYYSYYPDYADDHADEDNWDHNYIDFTLFLSTKAEGLASINSSCRYFHILPLVGGASECSGVAYAFRTGGHGSLKSGYPVWKLHTSIPHGGTSMVLKTERVFLPALENASKYYVRLVEEILIDARYNPFTEASEDNESGNDNTLKVYSGFVFIPAKVTLYDADGNALYHYSNRTVAEGAAKGHLGYAKGEWVEGADTGGDCWLEYYDPDDLEDSCGIRGWGKNRHCVGRPDGKGGRRSKLFYDSFKDMDDGEYMPYPPCAGYLEVQILAGVNGYNYGDSCNFGSDSSKWDSKGIYSLLRWCLYKIPVIDVVNNNLVFDDAELEDVEYSGRVNEAAKDEISIDTICGTADKSCPTAKGIYYRTSDGLQIQTLTRAGRTDHPEKLLIGTLYSQYAGRKTTLSGDAVIDGDLHYYTETNQGSKRFMLLSDVQDLRMDCTDAEYCELRPDEYDCIDDE